MRKCASSDKEKNIYVRCTHMHIYVRASKCSQLGISFIVTSRRRKRDLSREAWSLFTLSRRERSKSGAEREFHACKRKFILLARERIAQAYICYERVAACHVHAVDSATKCDTLTRFGGRVRPKYVQRL